MGWMRQLVAFVPSAPGCYALYRGGMVEYIGSTLNLRERLRAHGYSSGDYVKIRLSTRKGDWMMREYRLIDRINPPKNRHYRSDRSRPAFVRRDMASPCEPERNGLQ